MAGMAESVGPTRNQPRHQAKGLHGCGANRPAICRLFAEGLSGEVASGLGKVRYLN